MARTPGTVFVAMAKSESVCTGFTSVRDERGGLLFYTAIYGRQAEAEDNAYFIVRAWNNFDRLLAALKAQEAYSEHRLHCQACFDWDPCDESNALAATAVRLRREAIQKAEEV